MRTVAVWGGGDATVRVNPLKLTTVIDADGADANSPPFVCRRRKAGAALEGPAMSAAAASRLAREMGVTLAVDGDYLVFEAGAEPPAAALDLRHKAGILALLRPASGNWLIENWLEFFDQRKAIAEARVGTSVLRLRPEPSSVWRNG